MKRSGRLPAMIVSAFVGGAAVFLYMNLSGSEVSKLTRAMDTIQSEYYEPVERSKLIDGAIDGMLKSLNDPYTTYMDQEEAEAFNNNIHSSFEGIGATLEEVDGRIVIVAPIKGSPAEKAGILPGDAIIKIGDTNLEGLKVHEAVTLIRGEKGTKAELTIRRPGVTNDIRITVTRDTIPLDTVYPEMKEGSIGVIRVTSFAETTAGEFEKAVKQLVDQGMKGLVLDLRQNPGGLTETAQQIAETILQDGDTVVQFKGRSQPAQVVKAKHKDIGLDGMPVAVLVDQGSASASEIVAGALQQSAGIPLVGEKTFGKGTAQLNRPFTDGSSMKYTVAQWLTPNGSSINKLGLTPDHAVRLPEYAYIPLISSDTEWSESQFSDEIKTAQIMLKSLGYDPGREDGFFDAGTRKAVSSFQQSEGLNETGVMNGKTISSLIGKIRKLIAEQDTQLERALELVSDQLRT